MEYSLPESVKPHLLSAELDQISGTVPVACGLDSTDIYSKWTPCKHDFRPLVSLVSKRPSVVRYNPTSHPLTEGPTDIAGSYNTILHTGCCVLRLLLMTSLSQSRTGEKQSPEDDQHTVLRIAHLISIKTQAGKQADNNRFSLSLSLSLSSHRFFYQLPKLLAHTIK